MKFGTCIVLAILFGMAATKAVAAGWTTSVKKDPMTGDVNAYATSPSTQSTEPMSFPYTGTEAWLGVGCDSKHQWAYIGFSNGPIIDDTAVFDTRIKWDGQIETVSLWHDPGDRFLNVFSPDADAVISKIGQFHTVLLELDNWYGQGNIYFKFSLIGSEEALSKIRAACGLD